MRVLVVFCHPDRASFASALHDAVIGGLNEAGHAITDLDLYAEGFDPIFNLRDRAHYGDAEAYREHMAKYADQLAWAEGLVLLYPAWRYGMPAMLKGYFDRVWAPGISYDVEADGSVITSRLAHIRRIGVVTTYGSRWWLVRGYMGDPARKVIARGIVNLCAKNHRARWHVMYDMDRSTPARRDRSGPGAARYGEVVAALF